MPQAIQIEIQTEQQGLALLGAQRAAQRTGRELALHRTDGEFVRIKGEPTMREDMVKVGMGSATLA